MREASRNFLVGLTAITGLVLLGYLILRFGDAPRWTTPSYTLTLHFDDASGIASGTRVRMNGIDIGYVSDVSLKDPSYLGVTVVCEIEEQYLIPTSAIPTAKTNLLGGAAQLNLKTQSPAEGVKDTFLPTNDSAILKGNISDLADEITNVAKRLELKFGQIADEAVAALRYAKQQLEPRDTAAVDAGQLDGNLYTTIVRLDERMNEMKTTIDSINLMVNEEMRSEVKGVLTDARQKISDLSGRLVVVTDELSVSLAHLNGILADARAGKGTIGRLLNDPALFNSLNDAAQRISTALDEAKLLMQKWKAEGFPVRF